MASRKRDPEAKKQAIEAAAVELFAERGFAGTATSEIAERAGVAEGTVFRHFKNKKALLLSVTGLFVKRVIAPLATRTLNEVLAREHESLDEFLTDFFDERERTVARIPRVARAVLQEISLHEEVRVAVSDVFREQVIPVFFATIERLQTRGLIDPTLAPRSVMRLVVSVFGGWFVLSEVVAPEVDWDRDAERRASIAVLARGLRPS